MAVHAPLPASKLILRRASAREVAPAEETSNAGRWLFRDRGKDRRKFAINLVGAE